MNAVAPDALVEDAPAKLNLYLHVVGRRADGYHRLDSLVAFAGLGDQLSVAPADRLSLSIDGPFAKGLSAGDDNLVMKAARALTQYTLVASAKTEVQSSAERSLDSRFGGNHVQRSGAALTLTKNLPVASGIGGGSTDAAAALRLLNRLWDLNRSADDLAALGLSLGADVPVCLRRRSSFLRGIGDELSDAPPPPPAGLVLVNPGIPLPTPAVFQRREGPFSAPVPFPVVRDLPGFVAALAACRNDLEAPAIALVPAIRTILEALLASPGCRLARLSGSGATCFGLYDNPSGAAKAAAWLRAREGAWWVQAAGWDTPLA